VKPSVAKDALGQALAPSSVDAGSEAKTGKDPAGASSTLSYKERQKQATALHSARMALLDARDFLTKLDDPVLSLAVTVAKHGAVLKKVSDALSPQKIKLLASGDAMLALVSDSNTSGILSFLLQTFRHCLHCCPCHCCSCGCCFCC
jgi:hypothetical protein